VTFTVLRGRGPGAGPAVDVKVTPEGARAPEAPRPAQE
jgi:hypothetical protein